VISEPTVAFFKGHGTGNDFILIPDLENRLLLTEEQIRTLCDRHVGLGADGVIRVARDAATGMLFMDYRNADGSIAEMCGNGARVFVRVLQGLGHMQESSIEFLTRGGTVRADVHEDSSISIVMGPATEVVTETTPTVLVGSMTWPAVGVLAPNPHAVVFVENLAHAGGLLEMPAVDAGGAFPEGVNVEFVESRGTRHVAMRVYERGVGETQSCGTGACAVVWAASRATPDSPRGVEWRVDVPGGTVYVSEKANGDLVLRGPAVIVAEGEVHLG